MPGITADRRWAVPALLAVYLLLCTASVSAGESGAVPTEKTTAEAATPRPSKPSEGDGKRSSFTEKLSFDLLGLLSAPIAGMCGSGNEAPSYAEAFGVGWGTNLRAGYHLTSALAIRLDIGAIVYPGKGFDSLGIRNRLTDLTTAHFLAGLDLYFPLDSKGEDWFERGSFRRFQGLAPHVAVRLGLQYSDHVRWVEPKPVWTYWNSSVGFMFSLFFGADYRWGKNLGVTGGFELLFEDGAPASNRTGERGSAGLMFAAGLTGGVTLRF
ncbi:MAG: hypothetical protein ACYTFG_02740 [Planctomycetota bacterium]|jgi:hypothetical protein